ncbi:ribosome maturation factor RimP [Christensenellaceae bacterium OttesenSCG-928-L17]|nr:ribosome maturation factor RimP [Christensenellaceae bacterium OttesenSCG-928-L17]
MKTTETVLNIVRDPIIELGYELVDVEFKKEHEGFVLTIYIDGPYGVTINDCETVSRAIDPLLDEHDPIAQSYYLSVSSPGLDRPLKAEGDYRRNIGKPVVVKLYAKVDKKKEFIGELMRFEEEGIEIKEKGGTLRYFCFTDIAQVKPHIEF